MVVSKMPYKSRRELPTRIKNHLPEHAQEIYVSAFNNAHEEYADKVKRRYTLPLEVIAHKVAWSAVKKKYHKDESGDWVENL